MPPPGHAKADPRDRWLKLRLTAAEETHLAACVAAADARSVSDYVRRLIMGERPRARAGALQAELIRELNAIGNNLNQLSRKVNAGGVIEPVGFQAVIDEVRGVLRQLTLKR